ncbi:hypothetical protein WMY93_028925 [Mugilogobius chulae]|uniref:G domain-containing protein n=1 Tax=Mugilogobius chulae TaxID=88201 RepID=A0AAW0MVX4_9GOBI
MCDSEASSTREVSEFLAKCLVHQQQSTVVCYWPKPHGLESRIRPLRPRTKIDSLRIRFAQSLDSRTCTHTTPRSVYKSIGFKHFVSLARVPNSDSVYGRDPEQLENFTMGGSNSTPVAPAPCKNLDFSACFAKLQGLTHVSSAVLEQPWRKVNWGGKQDLLSLVREFKPATDEVSHVRILLYGPVGAGKSSFVNSVSTAVRGRSDIQAPTNACTDSTRSFTVEYRTHKIKKGVPKQYYPFVFNDIMGLESGEDVGVRAEDINLAMKGHVKDGYKFNPVSTLSESNTQFYNPSPTAEDKVHLLVCVLSANAPEIKPSVIQKMKEIRESARDLGIPQIAIATHIDEMCEEVKRDVKNVFRSKYLKEKMSEFSATVGIPMNCIFPLKNYCDEVDTVDEVDTLILTALKHMLQHADDFTDTL